VAFRRPKESLPCLIRYLHGDHNNTIFREPLRGHRIYVQRLFPAIAPIFK